MTQYTNPLTQKVFDILKPLVGVYMAQGVLKVLFGRLGISDASLSKNDLPKLADELSKGLVTFLGSDVTNRIVAQIKSLN